MAIDPQQLQNMSKADATREVAVQLEAETGQYNKQMEAAAGATGLVTEALVLTEKAFKKLFMTAGKTSVGIGAALTGMAGTAATVASRFEDSFARVQKTTGLTGSALAGLGQEIRSISTEVPVAVEELSRLADVSGQLGVESENLGLFAETAASLGVATSISSQQAVVALSQLIGIFGNAEEDVEGLASSFAVLANKTRASEQDILNFSVRVGGAASTVGATAEEIMGIGAAVTGMGIQVEAAGTAIQNVLLNMQSAAQRGGEELSNFAEVMGMTRQQFRDMQQSDPTRLFHDLVQSLSMAGDEAGQLLDKLGISDVQATRTLLALSSASEELTEALGMSTEAFREAEAVHELAAVRFDTLIQQFQVFKNAVSEVWRSIGMGLLPILQKAVEMVTGLVNVFNAIPQPVKSAMGVLAGIGGVVATVAGSVAMMIGTWHGLFAVMAMLPPAFRWLKATGAPAVMALKRAMVALALSYDLAVGGSRVLIPLLGNVAASAHAAGGGIRGLTAAMLTFTRSLTLKTLIFGFKEFGHAVLNMARIAIPRAISMLGMLAVPMLKVAAVAGTLFAAFKAGQFVWERLTQGAESASGSLEQLAESLGTAYKEANTFSGEMQKAEESTRSFTQANWDLIASLRELSNSGQVDLAITIGRNLVAGGASVEDATEAVERLLREAGMPSLQVGSLDIEGQIRMDSNVDQAADEVQRLNNLMDELGQKAQANEGIVDHAATAMADSFVPVLEVLGRVSSAFLGMEDSIEVGLTQAIRNATNNVDDDVEGAAAKLLEIRKKIDDLPAQAQEEAIKTFEDRVANVFPEIADQIRTDTSMWDKFQRAIGVGETSTEDLAQALIGDEGVQSLEEFRQRLENTGTEVEDLNNADLDQLLTWLREASNETAELADNARNTEQELGEFAQILQDAPEDTSRQRRFVEHQLDLKAQRDGLEEVIGMLDEYLRSLDEEEMYGQNWQIATKRLQEFKEEFADLELSDLEKELNAMGAAEAVNHLEQEIADLGVSLGPGESALKSGMLDLRSGMISDMERDLRRLMSQRDRMHERIADLEERRNERIQDLRESHNERMVELEEQHNERLGELHERKEERLEDAATSFQDRLDDISDREKEAYESMAQDLAESFDPTERVFSQRNISAKFIEENMRVQREQLERWAADVEKLLEAGFERDVLDAMGVLEPENFAQAHRLVEDMAADPQVIERINQEWKDRLDLTEAFTQDHGEDISEQFDEARDDAREAYKEQVDDINEAHKEAIAEQKENFREQQEDAKEALRERITDTKESMAEQIQDVKDEIADLARETTDSLTDLIEEGIDSEIEGIQRLAEALQKAIDDFHIPPQVTTEETRDMGSDRFLRKKGAEAAQRALEKDLAAANEQTWGQIVTNTAKAVDDVDEEFHGLEAIAERANNNSRDSFDDGMGQIPGIIDNAMGRAETTAETGTKRVTDTIADKLREGTKEASGIVRDYAGNLTDVVNPLLDVLGMDQIPNPVGSTPGGGRPSVGAFASGGMVEGAGGTDSVPIWASPHEFVVRPEAVSHYGPQLLDDINKMKFARGGEIDPDQMRRGQQFARTQEGKPYQWAAVGPGAYDCSGFWSAIVNEINGEYPFKRLFATGSFAGGGLPAGFLPGLGQVSVGVTQGSPGHMAGDVGGMSAEASSGHGVRVGSDARGSMDAMFNRHFHLGKGVFLGGPGSGVDLPEIPDLPFDVEDVGDKTMRFARAKAIEWLQENAYTSATRLGGSEGMATEESVRGIQHMAKMMLGDFGWGEEQWPALRQLVHNESGWNPRAANPNSSAYGLFQFLDSTWEDYGGKTTDPRGQIEAGLSYIQDRYGSPEAALSHWKARVPINGEDMGHWYAAGGVTDGPQTIGVGEKGREAILPLESAQGISALSEAISKAMGDSGERVEHHYNVDRVVAHDPNKMARQLQRLAQRKNMGGGV